MFYDHLDVSESRTDMSYCNLGVLVCHMAISAYPSPVLMYLMTILVCHDTVFLGLMAILNDVSLHNPGNYVLYTYNHVVVLVPSWYVLKPFQCGLAKSKYVLWLS